MKCSKLLFLLFVCYLVAYVFSKFVPYNMDEFIQYHAIICHHYPGNMLNIFRESCKAYDLDLLGTGFVLPLRVYAYVGSFSALYYYPLFLLWKSPLSARFLGLVFLLIQGHFLGKVFKINTVVVFFGLLAFFPYFFQHIVDQGPIAFQCTSLIIIYYLIHNWLKTLKVKYPLLIGFFVFCGVWHKLTFLWLFPGILLIFLIGFYENKNYLLQKENVQKFLIQFLIGFFTMLALLSFILLSSNPYDPNDKYLRVITSSQHHNLQGVLDVIARKWGVVACLINPMLTVQRIYFVRDPDLLTYFYDFFIYFSALLIALLFYLFVKGSRGETLRIIFLYFAFPLTLFFIIRTKQAVYMHHAILAFPFLIIATMHAIKLLRNHFKVFAAQWFLIFLALNSFFFFTFTTKNVLHPSDHPSQEVIHKILSSPSLAKKYFYIIVDWGMYYYQGLYGPKWQSVLYLEPFLDHFAVNGVKNHVNVYGRKPLFVYNSIQSVSNIDLIRSEFNVSTCPAVKSDGWQILIDGEGCQEISQSPT